MLFLRTLVPTVREVPADATHASQALLLRGGFVRRVAAGLYDFLPLGLRVLRKAGRIAREEMDRAGAQEVLFPTLVPAELLRESGRLDALGDALFRLKDRKGAEYVLGLSHEEAAADIARRDLRSWRDLPKVLYQVRSRFRDEPRPRGGLLRSRELVSKDAYSFDATEEEAMRTLEAMRVAYVRVFERARIACRTVAGAPGALGATVSVELQAPADAGEDIVLTCDACDYAANAEVAEVGTPDPGRRNMATTMRIIRVHTPGKKTIDEVAKFLQVRTSDTLKSLLYVTPGSSDVVMVVVRGDHLLNEAKLARELGASEVHLATEDDVRRATGAEVGFAGPLGFQGRILIDRAATLVRNAVTGACETDYHLANVSYGRDFEGEVVDVRLAEHGDPCPRCTHGHLTSQRSIEVGHLRVLGMRYCERMGARYLDSANQERPLVMGVHGIGLSRLVATCVEQHHDDDGVRWPMSLSPYHVHLCTLGKNDAVLAAGRRLHDDLEAAGVEVLWDDRDERPGIKFKDADLIGVPLRLTLGEKGLSAGQLELKPRSERDPKKVELLDLASAPGVLAARVRSMLR